LTIFIANSIILLVDEAALKQARDAVKQAREQGNSPDKIKEVMRNAGYSLEDINEVVGFVSQDHEPPTGANRISKWVFIGFNAFMALFFIYSFLYPTENGYWLFYYGFPIMVLEFMGVFVGIYFAFIRSKGSANPGALIFLVVPLILAFMFTFLINILLFLYFLVSTAVKHFASSTEHHGAKLVFAKAVAAIVLSMFLAIVLSFVLNAIFPENQGFPDEGPGSLLKPSSTPSNVKVTVNIALDPSFIMAWGACYYILLILFELFNAVKVNENL